LTATADTITPYDLLSTPFRISGNATALTVIAQKGSQNAASPLVCASPGSDRRAMRYSLRSAMQELPYLSADVPPQVNRLRMCGRAVLGQDMALTLKDGKAGVRRVETCGRGLVCPSCSSTIREARRVYLSKILAASHDQGCQVFFATFTIRHYKKNSLVETLSVVRGAWRKMASQREWRRLSEKYGIKMVSSLEITHGKRGFHPHLHCVFISNVPTVPRDVGLNERESSGSTEVKHPMKADDILEVREWLKQAWITQVTKAGSSASQEHALDWREASGPKNLADLARYLTKGQGAEPEEVADLIQQLRDDPERARTVSRGLDRRLSMEITRSDLKSSNPKGSDRSTAPMFSVLVEACFGDLNALRTWWELETATRGLRWWRVSHGLAEALGLKEDNRDDEQVANERETLGVPVIGLSGKSWWRLIRFGMAAPVLTLLEEEGVCVTLSWLKANSLNAWEIATEDT
jgi:hypothetical protein